MNLSRFPCVCLASLGLLVPLTVPAEDNSGGWTETSKQGNITLYERERAGTSIKEVRAVGKFYSPNWMVRNVLDDADHYKEFMPYVVESRLLARDAAKHTLLTYAKIDPPLISKRDYTILIHDESRPGPGEEMTYLSRWEGANGKGPAEQAGIVRVKNNEGSWLLEPSDNGAHTRATYTLYTDGGGGIPVFLLNSLNKKRLTELFEVVSKRVQEKQYRQTRPVLP